MKPKKHNTTLTMVYYTTTHTLSNMEMGANKLIDHLKIYCTPIHTTRLRSNQPKNGI